MSIKQDFIIKEKHKRILKKNCVTIGNKTVLPEHNCWPGAMAWRTSRMNLYMLWIQQLQYELIHTGTADICQSQFIQGRSIISRDDSNSLPTGVKSFFVILSLINETDVKWHLAETSLSFHKYLTEHLPMVENHPLSRNLFQKLSQNAICINLFGNRLIERFMCMLNRIHFYLLCSYFIFK